MSTITPTPVAPGMSSRNQGTTAPSPAHPASADTGTAIVVTLTPSDQPTDRRTIFLQPGASMTIGRASTSGGSLTASSHNALFPRPVVSRTHAELRAHPHRPSHQQITITDSDSTHGTYVNDMRLEAHHPFALRDGDEIKLGERVSRGDETHNAVTLHYRRVDSLSSLLQPKHPLPTKGFQVPSESEDDDSDPPSEDESVVSGDEEAGSSANTTPEQTKMPLGSQEKPIELDKPIEVVYLDDDDDEGEVTFADNNAERARVQPSLLSRIIGRAGSIELGEPVMPVVKDTYDSDEDEVEQMDEHDDEDDAVNAYMSEEEDFSDREQESDNALQVRLSEDHDDEDEGEDEDEELDLCPPPRSALSQNITDASVVKETLFGGSAFDAFPLAHSQPAFDPVRDVQLPNPATASQPRAPSNYTYDNNYSYGMPRKSTTDTQHSSRWDIQPSVVPPSQYSFNNSQAFFTAPPPPPPQELSFGGPSVRPSGFDWAFPDSAKDPTGSSAPPSAFVQPPFTNPSFSYGNWTSNTQSEQFINPSFTPRSPRKKISIPDITQRAEEERTNFVMPEPPTMDEATFEFAAQDPAPLATTGSKRKADEMLDSDFDDDECIEVEDSSDGPAVLEKMLARANAEMASSKQSQENAAGVSAPATTAVQMSPPAKRARVAGAFDVAKTVGKYAAVAGAGAGGMVVFLASPYAQQVLEWMG